MSHSYKDKEKHNALPTLRLSLHPRPLCVLKLLAQRLLDALRDLARLGVRDVVDEDGAQEGGTELEGRGLLTIGQEWRTMGED